MNETRSLTRALARRSRAINWIVAGAAILAMAAFSPSKALAQITLTPPSAVNLTGITHTVTAQLTGICSEIADGSPSCDGSGYCNLACTSNAQCADAASDDFCNFGAVTGQTIFIGVVSGPNSGTAAVQTTVDGNGQATFSYTSTVAGTDTLEACLDSDGAGDETTGTASGDLALCITDTASAEDGPTSNTVTKTWVQAGVILTPSTAYNPVGAIHTVTAQVTGICSELDGTPSCDGSGYCDVTCTSNADCDDTAINGFNDDFCNFSSVQGQTIYIGVVGGPNNGAFATQTTVDANGQATFQYSSSVPGVDTIQGCLDTDGGPDEGTGTTPGDLALCILDSGTEGGDTASNQVTKHWFGPPTVSLTPTAAANPTSTGTPLSTHTLTATIGGGDLGTCKTSNNDGAACNTATDCGGVNAVCDLSGFTVEFGVNSGPNAGDLGAATTDVNGAATKTYSDVLDGAGLDTLQACLDTDVVTGDGGSETAALCIAESGSDAADVASNPAYKRWEGVPALLLQNLDLGATLATGMNVYTTAPAYNPVGTSHTVLATIGAGTDADLGVCVGGPTPGAACDANADCGTGGTCNLSGYPIGFLVVSGPNAGTTGWGVSLANGTASFNYPDNGGAGLDTISACLDTDMGVPGSPNDEASVAECLADSVTGQVGQGDFASNPVQKYWLSKYVTGGGKVTPTTKSWNTFGGVVGQKPGSPTALIGEWQEVAHPAKGGNSQCHWSAFSAFALSCSSGSCGTQPDTVVFTTLGGSASCGNVTVKIIDGQKKPDKIQVTGSSNPAINVPLLTLVGGNFTIHP